MTATAPPPTILERLTGLRINRHGTCLHTSLPRPASPGGPTGVVVIARGSARAAARRALEDMFKRIVRAGLLTAGAVTVAVTGLVIALEGVTDPGGWLRALAEAIPAGACLSSLALVLLANRARRTRARPPGIHVTALTSTQAEALLDRIDPDTHRRILAAEADSAAAAEDLIISLIPDPEEHPR